MMFLVPKLRLIWKSMRIGEISDGTKSRLLKRGCLSAHERHHWTVVSKKRLSDYIKPGYLMGKIRRLGARVHSWVYNRHGNTWSRHICGDWVRECFASRSSLGKRSHSIFGLCIMIALLRILVIFWEQIQRSGLLATHDSCVCNFCRNCEWMAHRMWTGMVYVLEIAGDILQ